MDNVQPGAEVLVEDVSLPAEILTWSWATTGWWANVRWRLASGESQSGTFPAREVRDGDIGEGLGF